MWASSVFAAAVILLGSLQHVDAATPSLDGTWIGRWERDGDRLEVVTRFERASGGWSGSFDSERLRVTGIPFSDIAVKGERITWKLVGDATTLSFTGTLAGGTLAGTFEEGGKRGTFRLARADREEPQVQERDFAFVSDGVPLSGTLLLPRDSGQKPAAIVFSHGSGAEGRWASRFLAARFAQAGVAALIFDKRGVGESGGDWRKATPDDLVRDVAAAVDALRGSSMVDPARIGIHGHSQGGTLAPLAAARGRAAFVIASAAGGLPPDAIEIDSIENSLNVKAMSEEDAALARVYIMALVGAAYRGESRERLAAAWEQVKDKPWAFRPPADDSHYWSFSPAFQAFDLITHWREISVPVLLVYGDLDERVPPRASAARIMQAVLEGSGHSAAVQIFPGADHSFRVRSPDLVWPSTVTGYPDALIEWTRHVVETLRD